MKYLLPIFFLFILSCDKNDDDSSDLGIVGSWYGGIRNGSIPTIDDFRCTHLTFLYDNTFIIEDPSSETIYNDGNWNFMTNNELILSFFPYGSLSGVTFPIYYSIENSSLMLKYGEPEGAYIDDATAKQTTYDYDIFFMNMKEVGIYDCYDDKDVDGILDTQDECISRYLELDCSNCNTNCEDDYINNFIIDFNSSTNVIITLYDNCFNEYILDENYLVQGENEINLDEFDNGYYNIVIKENENDIYPLLNHTFFIEDNKYFLCHGERIIPPPIK